MKKALLVFVFALGGVLSKADHRTDQYEFKHVSIEQGLLVNNVLDILQDDFGFLWFATQNGLSRFDGNHIKNYLPNAAASHTINNKKLFALAKTSNNDLWIGTAVGMERFDPQHDKFQSIKLFDSDNNPINGTVRKVQVDGKQKVWASIDGYGIVCVDTMGHTLKKIPLPVQIRSFCFDRNGTMWISSDAQGLFCLDTTSLKVAHHPSAYGRINLKKQTLGNLSFVSPNKLWICTEQYGVVELDITTHSIREVLSKDKDGNRIFARTLIKRYANEIWIGSEKGVFVVDPATGKYKHISQQFGDLTSLSDNAIHALYVDKNDNVWIGTYFGGVNYLNKQHSLFRKYHPTRYQYSISGKSISEIIEDAQGRIWVATEDGGLNLIEHTTIRHDVIGYSNVHSLQADQHHLWAGTFSGGLYRVNLNTLKTEQIYNTTTCPDLGNDNIYSLLRDEPNHLLYVGTSNGLYLLNTQTNRFDKLFQESIASTVVAIKKDKAHRIWVATVRMGIFCFDPLHRTIKQYPLRSFSLLNSTPTSLLVDSKDNVWVATEDKGIWLLDQTTGQFKPVPFDSFNLTIDAIYQMVEDHNGLLWLSTNNGLYCYDAGRSKIFSYTTNNGIICNQFNYRSGVVVRSGGIYMGSVNGLVYFHPNQLTDNTLIPNIRFTELQVNGQVATPAADQSLLTQSMFATQLITIEDRSSVITVQFEDLNNYNSSGLSYMIEGLYGTWTKAYSRNSVTFSDLPYGSYLFKVAYVKDNQVEGCRVLRIEVPLPFYFKPLCILLYVLIVIGVVTLFVRWFILRNRRKKEELVRDVRQNTQTELYRSKINFFTYITHEIRTPLSLIKTPVDQIVQQVSPDDPNYRNLQIVKRNTDRLLVLVNQILDFRRVESDALLLNYVNTDVVALVRDTLSDFTAQGGDRLRVECITTVDQLQADIDKDIVTKIVSNLCGNAVKHAHSFVQVQVGLHADRVWIEVINDGDLIPVEHSKNIFVPFFKLDEHKSGSGLGLAFVKSLVELHGGEVAYMVQERRYNVFRVELPLLQTIKVSVEHLKASQHEKLWINNQADQQPDKPRLLLVDDNHDFLSFLGDQFGQTYQMYYAENGQEALECLEHTEVDIIVSDLMMPLMDGGELCAQVKQDIRYSHIPFVVLTAKTMIESKIDALKLGADAYIDKPYSMEHLMATIENLLASRKRLKLMFQQNPNLQVSDMVTTGVDKDFLGELLRVIDEHLDNESLGVDVLSEQMNMSRASLYRKMKSISDLTPNDFIKVIRLRRAAELLSRSDLRIGEIASIVGFTSSSYFTKCFMSQFGLSPKEYRAQEVGSPNQG